MTLKVQTLADLANLPATPGRERAFRRGYCAGWIEAADLVVRSSSFYKHSELYDALYNHWQDHLQPWSHCSDFSTIVFPPHAISPRCVYCGGPAEHRDHVIPRGRPGWDDAGNLVPSCAPCNIEKSDRTPEEWLGLSIDEVKQRAIARLWVRDWSLNQLRTSTHTAPQGQKGTQDDGN